ncbi:aldo/keto reductase [Rhodococcus sp. 06-412-2C]|uniref:aldo/keto reductase n=1 Tax=unclassified Rhodococcus (in: high G+C Gram-positive bacteria) TaxID=192944 RepID=UPI000B9AC81B|nr:MULTISPECIES: aldo/keto reductase [unclassified Rhodococcus (in: high G+C Gram-positive bacteria)]OZC91594.1 aldo/keto reductase [Rhodococcus sp. 06-412-2C]OZC92161.1 aldo/keto reductase [Rhodococcus sp. 06-412-2B]
MRTFPLPQTGASVSSIVLGFMRITDLDENQIRRLVDTALDVGVTVFDHADIYGGTPHTCEKRFGDAVKLTPAQRERVDIQSKVGIREGWFDFSKDHIVTTVEESLTALGVDHLDTLLLHRPDSLVEPEDVASAFDELHASGKVLTFGVSNHTPGQIELLKTAVKQPILIDQVQLSIVHSPLIAAGLTANMSSEDQSIDRDNGLLDYARSRGITLQAWSPFQSGSASGVFVGDRVNYPELNIALDEIAESHGSTPSAIATAWITRHPANIQVVLGTTNPDRVVEAAAGSDLRLTRQEWYRLFIAAGHTLP